MSRRWGSRLRLGGSLLLVVAVTLAMLRAGSGSLAAPPLSRPAAWGDWLAGRDPVIAAVALVRVIALLAACYLLAASVVGLALRVVGADGLVALADRLTVPALRRLLAATAGLTLATGISPALAFASRSPVPTAVAIDTTTTTIADGPAPTLTMRLLGPDAAPVPEAVPPPVAAPASVPAGDSWTVRPGECFWSIAADVLERAWSRPPSDAEIVPYWRTLIEENRSRLGDRDNADLIFPGQVFTLPPLPAT